MLTFKIGGFDQNVKEGRKGGKGGGGEEGGVESQKKLGLILGACEG